MQWRAKIDKAEYKWNHWFAWYPVQIGVFMYWLVTVERKRWKITGPDDPAFYDYKILGSKYDR